MNDPIDRIVKDGQWSLWKKITNIGSSIYDGGRKIAGKVVEELVDSAVNFVNAVVDIGKRLVDAPYKFIEDVKDAYDWVVTAAVRTISVI